MISGQDAYRVPDVPVEVPDRFETFVKETMASILRLFAVKNKNYAPGTVYVNIEEAAYRVFGDCSAANCLKVFWIYMDKHMSALARGGVRDPECKSRLMDILLYSLLALFMLDDKEGDVSR